MRETMTKAPAPLCKVSKKVCRFAVAIAATMAQCCGADGRQLCCIEKKEEIMQIDIDKIPALLALLGEKAPPSSPASRLIGRYVIVRSRDSGVHAGVLSSINGRHVSLTDSRRLWYWQAAKEHTLSAVSLHGLASGSKIASAVSQIEILDACEIIPATEAACDSIKGMKSHVPS